MEILKRLEDILQKKNSLFYQWANPGLTEPEIRQYLSSVGLEPNKELIALYQWHNGCDNGFVDFFGFTGMFLSMKTSIDARLAEGIEEWLVEGTVSGKYLFHLGWDDSIFIYLNQGSEHYGKLYIESPGSLIIDPISIFDSLESLFISVVECFDKGVYFIDEEGKIDYENIDMKYEIFENNNPRSDYWKRTTLV